MWTAILLCLVLFFVVRNILAEDNSFSCEGLFTPSVGSSYHRFIIVPFKECTVTFQNESQTLSKADVWSEHGFKNWQF